MRSMLFDVQKCRRVFSLRPIGSHQHPGPGLNPAMFSLPGFNMLLCEQEIRITGRFTRDVNHAGGRKKFFDGDGIGCIFFKGLAGDPMYGRVEMRAGVFSTGEIIPVPSWPTMLVLEHFFPPYTPTLSQLS